MLRYTLAPLLALSLLATPHLGQTPPGKTGGAGREKKDARQAPQKDPTTRELLRWLEEPLNVRQYQVNRDLKEVLRMFTETFATRKKALPLLVDTEAFKEANPDAADVYETQVRFPPLPAHMTFEKALRTALSKIPTNNATFLVRRGCIEITALERGAAARLLEERVTANFNKKPLAEAIEELADMTGATILLDQRVGEQARTPISALFRNTISLEAAVRLLAKMAGLRAELDEENILFITTRAKEGSPEVKSDLRLRDRPLNLALKDLANWSATSIILDPHAKSPVSLVPGFCFPNITGLFADSVPSGEVLVSATFKRGTSPRGAACILARMVGLEAVAVDNAVFVTTRKIAEEMRSGIKKDRSTKPALTK